MKKIFKYFVSVVAIIVTSFLVSCSKKSDEQTVKSIDSSSVENFTKVIAQDLKTIQDSAANVVFYESQVVFKNNCTSDSNSIIEMMNVFQADEYCYQVVHNGTDVKTIKIHQWWLEDMPFDPSEIISLDSAITRLNAANCMKPVSNLVTLRKPVGPTLVNPTYYFGSIKTFFVGVDGITSDVKIVK